MLVRQGLREDAELFERIQNPVIERAVIFKLQRTDRVRYIFKCVRNAVREVIKRIDTPGVAGTVVLYVPNPVNHRIAHHNIGVSHVNLEAQNMTTIGKLSVPHLAKELQIFCGAAIAKWAGRAGLIEVTAIGMNGIRTLAIHIRFATLD